MGRNSRPGWPFVNQSRSSLQALQTKQSYLFNSSTVSFVGAGRPAKLASVALNFLIIDDVDKLRDFDVFGETNTINVEYKKASQSKLFCPCPLCGHEQDLQFRQIKFSHCK